MPTLLQSLPSDLAQLFEAAAASGDDAPVRAALARRHPDARGCHARGTVLAQRGCTMGMARFAVARGTIVDAGDDYGRTPLHEAAARRWGAGLTVPDLLALGADPHLRCKEGRTALHSAASAQNVDAVRTLLAHGVDARATDRNGDTALEWALRRLSNPGLVDIVPVVTALLEAGDVVSDRARRYTEAIAEQFEFHRESFAKDLLDSATSGVRDLCGLMGLAPRGPRVRHDGTSPIVATAAGWQRQHQELWNLLVPSRGPCETVQGEVVRIAGRIGDELQRNGGCNWDADYRAMARALIAHLGSGTALPPGVLAEAEGVVSTLLYDMGGCGRLAELAVAWVTLNPQPMPLTPPSYRR